MPTVSRMAAMLLFVAFAATLPVSGMAGGEGGCCGGGGLVTFSIVAPPANFWTARGRLGEPIRAASGERIEVWWTGFFPRYELRYFRDPSDGGRTMGRCHFSQGCNRAFFTAPSHEPGAAPPCFAAIVWESYDYGHDGGTPGYLDRYVHRFDACRGRYTETLELLHYRCPPPVSFYPDVCAATCEPPYEEETVGGLSRPRVFRSIVVRDEAATGDQR